MRRVREILLAADPRISDYIKYGSLLLGYEGDLVSFVQVTTKNINLMFNNGAKIPGDALSRSNHHRSRSESPGLDEAGLAKHLEMSAHGWLANTQRAGDIHDTGGRRQQLDQDVNARRLRENSEAIGDEGRIPDLPHRDEVACGHRNVYVVIEIHDVSARHAEVKR